MTMTWDTDGTDVDLWVTGPDAEKILYSHRQGAAGGTLDTDVTTGFGPETYTQARLQRGTYRIQAHAYGIARPTRVEVTTVRFEGTPGRGAPGVPGRPPADRRRPGGRRGGFQIAASGYLEIT